MDFKKLILRTLVWSMKLLSSAVVLHLFKYTMRPYMGYCCHVWAGAPTFYLDELQQGQYGTVGTLLPHSQNVTSLSLFYRCYLGRRPYEMVELVLLLSILVLALLVIVIVCMIFLWQYLDVITMRMSAVSFLVQLCSGGFSQQRFFPCTMI